MLGGFSGADMVEGTVREEAVVEARLKRECILDRRLGCNWRRSFSLVGMFAVAKGSDAGVGTLKE